ncbi:MAG: NUDIX hydrolase [Bacteriovorax sp.]|nr:NUDIX hydrolase [Bacteriovorax sp.]
MKKWATFEKVIVQEAHVFRYFTIIRQSPTTQKMGKFDIVQCFNWVNIIAITPENKIVLIKQYRHGTDSITTEIPGGAVNLQEDMLLAAQRELLEETGYSSLRWEKLGRVDVNPAFMTNYCETYLALDAIKTHEQNLDPFEEIDVFLEDKNKIKSLIKNGEITHSLIIAAIYLYLEKS